MRLREPMYGMRIATMHLVMHFSLLINMILIDVGVFDFKI